MSPPTCRNCKAGGYVLSLDKVSCSHDEAYHDPDHVCSLHPRLRQAPETPCAMLEEAFSVYEYIMNPIYVKAGFDYILRLEDIIQVGGTV